MSAPSLMVRTTTAVSGVNVAPAANMAVGPGIDDR